jgi:phosphoribosylglycinamide formyltransferase 1
MPNQIIRLGVLASGRGTNLQSIIDAVDRKTIDVSMAVVISDKEQARALERARRHNIKGIFIDPKPCKTREDYDMKIVEVLNQQDVNLVVLSGYMRIVTSRLIEPYRYRMINIHPSLLPSFPGLRAQQKALQWGVKISGCTVHFVDESLDQGPIIIQAAVPVHRDDTEDSLSSRILEQEHRILPQAIQYIAEGRLEVVGRQVLLKDGQRHSEGLIISPHIGYST